METPAFGAHGTGRGYDVAPDARFAENVTGYGRDTSYLSVVDRWGNAVSLYASDFPQSPMVPGTGLTLGIRMTQFRLDPKHPPRSRRENAPP